MTVKFESIPEAEHFNLVVYLGFGFSHGASVAWAFYTRDSVLYFVARPVPGGNAGVYLERQENYFGEHFELRSGSPCRYQNGKKALLNRQQFLTLRRLLESLPDANFRWYRKADQVFE